ncbi:hypothetical protein RIR_jg40149.t1 [Rhizophagus irregularis DAOM 181602=DAOM 197198]|nr:hypothetical protein RIR_jg40149.t1 [Rhizophagus irregularis DAOM 181602=DAOM 197198]
MLLCFLFLVSSNIKYSPFISSCDPLKVYSFNRLIRTRGFSSALAYPGLVRPAGTGMFAPQTARRCCAKERAHDVIRFAKMVMGCCTVPQKNKASSILRQTSMPLPDDILCQILLMLEIR